VSPPPPPVVAVTTTGTGRMLPAGCASVKADGSNGAEKRSKPSDVNPVNTTRPSVGRYRRLKGAAEGRWLTLYRRSVASSYANRL